MGRSSGIVFAVLLTLLLGVTLQPDDGTAVSRPPGVGVQVDGANHAKPLPRPAGAVELLPALATALVLAAGRLTATGVSVFPRRHDRARAFEQWPSRAAVRRGPPWLI